MGSIKADQVGCVRLDGSSYDRRIFELRISTCLQHLVFARQHCLERDYAQQLIEKRQCLRCLDVEISTRFLLDHIADDQRYLALTARRTISRDAPDAE